VNDDLWEKVHEESRHILTFLRRPYVLAMVQYATVIGRAVNEEEDVGLETTTVYDGENTFEDPRNTKNEYKRAGRLRSSHSDEGDRARCAR